MTDSFLFTTSLSCRAGVHPVLSPPSCQSDGKHLARLQFVIFGWPSARNRWAALGKECWRVDGWVRAAAAGPPVLVGRPLQGWWRTGAGCHQGLWAGCPAIGQQGQIEGFACSACRGLWVQTAWKEFRRVNCEVRQRQRSGNVWKQLISSRGALEHTGFPLNSWTDFVVLLHFLWFSSLVSLIPPWPWRWSGSAQGTSGFLSKPNAALLV